MSYVVIDSRGMGTSAAVSGAQVGAEAGSGGGASAGGVVDAAASALSTIVGGAINLANNIGLWRQQRRDVASQREDSWAAEVDALNREDLLRLQSAEELAAQNAVIEERNRALDEQERAMARERAALENQISRSRLEAEQQQRAAIAGQFRMPTWGWFAIAGVSVVAIAGVGAYMGLKSEEN